VRNKNIKPQGIIVILTLLFLSIILGSFQTPLRIAEASAESQPATSELIADAGGSMSLAAGPEAKPVSEVAHTQMPASPRSESLKLLLLGSFLLLIATGIQLLSSRKNKPKSRPA
jgi:hypothetical protein